MRKLFPLFLVVVLVVSSSSVGLPVLSREVLASAPQPPSGLYRTRVAVRQPADWARLERLGVTVLERGDDWALVLADGDLSSNSTPAATVANRQPPGVAPPDLRPPSASTGFVPPARNLSHLKGKRMPRNVLADDLPSSLDWRDHGGVTPVKHQGGCGACYAFAAIANVESKLLLDGAGTYDLSENNAKECNWHQTSCSGGNYDQLASHFSQKGIVLESCDPYVASDVDCNTTCAISKTLLDWRIISGDSVPDTEVLKAYVFEYGPVHTTLNVAVLGDLSGYDGSYALYHATPSNWGIDHAVLVVGWDDTLTHEGGSGGWIFKNSWGTDFGDNGYGIVAYGSANFGMYSSFMHDWQEYDSSGELLYYDEGGCNSDYGYRTASGFDTTGWGLAKFIPKRSGKVTRVEFWTTDRTTDVDVYVYDEFNTETTSLGSLLYSELNNAWNEAGYHSVRIDPPLVVTADDDLIAVVKFTNATYDMPIPIDGDGPSEMQRTYISHTGLDDSWIDAGTWGRRDVGIRLRMSDLSGPPPPPPPPPPPVPRPTVVRQITGWGHFGNAVAGVRDVNGDGVPDFAAGAT